MDSTTTSLSQTMGSASVPGLLLIFATVLGILGSVASIAALLQAWARRRERRYLERALALLGLEDKERDLSRRIEARQLQENALAARISELRQGIAAMPREARKAVLRDRLEAGATELERIYRDTQKTVDDLRALGDDVTIHPEIRRYVEAELQPQYLRHRRIALLKTLLTIVTTAAAASSLLLSEWFGRDIAMGLFALATLILIGLARQLVTRDGLRGLRKQLAVLRSPRTAVSVGAFFILSAVVVGSWAANADQYRFPEHFSIAILLVGISGGIILLVVAVAAAWVRLSRMYHARVLRQG